MFSPISSSYSRSKQHQRLQQVPTRGNRISILELWQPEQQFKYALAPGGFNGASYLKVMGWIAEKAALMLAQTGRLTVVVLAFSIHKPEVRQQWQCCKTKACSDSFSRLTVPRCIGLKTNGINS